MPHHANSGTFVAGDPRLAELNRAAGLRTWELRRQKGLLGFPKKNEKYADEKTQPIPIRERAAMGGKKISWLRKQETGDPFPNRNMALARERSADAQRGYPQPMPSNVAVKYSEFKSFAQKIRHKTNDGWELIDAVYEVFCRARKAQADQIIMDSATWLADRGFGKPVQVGQLLDGEGNPVAFTLWSPATQEPIGDVITIQNGKVAPNEPPAGAEPDLVEYQPRPELLEAPKPYEPPAKDGYTDGLARAWGKDQESRKGE